jgi:hypothetical protein
MISQHGGPSISEIHIYTSVALPFHFLSIQLPLLLSQLHRQIWCFNPKVLQYTLLYTVFVETTNFNSYSPLSIKMPSSSSHRHGHSSSSKKETTKTWIWACCCCSDAGMTVTIENCPECGHLRCDNCQCDLVRLPNHRTK